MGSISAIPTASIKNAEHKESSAANKANTKIVKITIALLAAAGMVKLKEVVIDTGAYRNPGQMLADLDDAANEKIERTLFATTKAMKPYVKDWTGITIGINQSELEKQADLLHAFSEATSKIDSSPDDPDAYLDLAKIVFPKKVSAKQLNDNGCNVEEFCTHIGEAGRMMYAKAENFVGSDNGNIEDVLIALLENEENKETDDSLQATYNFLMFEDSKNLLTMGDKCMEFVDSNETGPSVENRVAILNKQVELYLSAIEKAELDPAKNPEMVSRIYSSIYRTQKHVDKIANGNENTDSIKQKAMSTAEIALAHAKELLKNKNVEAAWCALFSVHENLTKTLVAEDLPHQFDASGDLAETLESLQEVATTARESIISDDGNEYALVN